MEGNRIENRERALNDFNSNLMNYYHYEAYDLDENERPQIFHHHLVPEYSRYMFPSHLLKQTPWEAACPKFVEFGCSQSKHPVFTIRWMQLGKKVITGHSNGEIHIWNGLTLKFDKVNTGHRDGIRAMVWVKDEHWLVTADKKGYIIYWDPTLTEISSTQAHSNTVRDLSFSPSWMKFASCSDDRIVKIFDFVNCKEELVFEGHRSDVKCCDWHPTRTLVVTGARDTEIKFWDPKSGKEVRTLQAHYNAINRVKWNMNGNWLLSGSKDKSIKIFDLRMMKDFHTF